MGAAQSGMTPLESFCREQAMASKKCMYKHNYERESYQSDCSPQFQNYRDCKKRWFELARQLRLAAEKPNDTST
ncbi:hypothetical protein BASA50_000274 [Batrachochytrium salamandrivorans]|uniref:CHCH domain-containing protein n=1 Tax=Batrachochytrium salamandrivorans TaxID=1357716 RepID=A0ABQ8EUR5_9FUNG|nr:hypothetical protein BASA62_009968 [Batrachochytrium salamandrivorans]KAH6584297.1 hypothetical protein BASA60_001032 [Batrachochytrium salamandrivorans]KAH6586910.1 hypothetical protein BASA50_000274 [Batrachochytrium salamandrivorans]KAH6591747.1 hypothetical protein BASA61_004828 [Batrachochytrium salamandrivorans]KAH9250401.1 hypothetical protein BASA81_011809 [Batrachochytrium salamandrivorans]